MRRQVAHSPQTINGPEAHSQQLPQASVAGSVLHIYNKYKKAPWMGLIRCELRSRANVHHAQRPLTGNGAGFEPTTEIGRASCRERAYRRGGGVSRKEKRTHKEQRI